MPSLADHQSSKFVKILYIGDSASGKTGSLTSLVAAGYKLRILDMDNGLDSLRQFVLKECPEKIINVDFETRRDEYKATNAGPVVQRPKAYTEAVKLMTTWTDNSNPSEWGDQTVFVLDTLSALSKAAFEWAKGLNPTAKDPRQWFFQAQQSIENVLALLTSDAFHCNVIVISHVNYREQADGTNKGFANAIGSAMGPVIPRYFNTLVLAETIGTGKNVRRKIKTLPTGIIDLKNPVPFKIDAEMDLGTGLAELFSKIKEN